MTTKNSMFKLCDLEKLVSDKKSCVKRRLNCNKKLLLMPIQLADLKASIKECLESKVTMYDTDLDGIVLSFRNVKVYTMVEDDPGNAGLPVNYTSDLYVFKPKVGSVLTGVVSEVSPKHVACLVHKIFNVTIPRPVWSASESWQGDCVQVGEEITFTVDHLELDIQGQLPYIRGIL